MADKCRELPRGPRGALLSSFPHVFPHITSLREGKKKRKRPRCQTLPQRVRPTVITKKTKEGKIVRFFVLQLTFEPLFFRASRETSGP
jgi:hypothetical protein